MMTNWKSATCERCVFRDDKLCRRFPNPALVAYGDREFHKACAEYTEEGQLPLKQIGDIPTAPFTTYDVADEAWKAT